MNDDGDAQRFSEQLRAIEVSRAKAQRYLDRTAPKAPQAELPSAHWRETGERLSTAQGGQPACGAKAIEYVQRSMPSAGSLMLKNPTSCIRPHGHDGPHASEMIPHIYRKSLWKALSWD